ncbi:hypothetical protein [Clostridium oceanicum]|uniref:Uncharacterized protein n=1 Tax=Clostridium oceanicum TaxID=1543 RepID=A0ABP3V7I9_9CLOT
MLLEELINIAKVLNENGLKGKKRDNFLRDQYNMSSRTWQKKIKGTPIKYNNSTKRYETLDSFNLEKRDKIKDSKERRVEESIDESNKLQDKIDKISKETLKEPKSKTKVTTKGYQGVSKDKLKNYSEKYEKLDYINLSKEKEFNNNKNIDKLEENKESKLKNTEQDIENNYDEVIEVKDFKEVMQEMQKVTTPLKIQEFKNMKSDIEILKEQMNFILDRFKEEEFKRENIIEIPKIDLENYDLKGEIGSRSFKTYKYVLDDFKKFCKDRNESQKDLIAIALLEFMKKYNR